MSLRIIVVCIALLLSTWTRAQILGDFKHHQFYSKVIMTYHISGLAPHQRMEVNVYCSDDNFKKSLATVSGNGVGTTVSGNGEKTVVWDVLKDRPRLEGDYSFEVKAVVLDAEKSKGVEVSAPLTIDDRKSMVFKDIASSLSNFINEGKDLATAFRNPDERIFDDPTILRRITDATIQYNDAYNKLNSERIGYEKQVLTYWKNEAVYTDLRNLFDYALGELHRVNVLGLNDVMRTINEINDGGIRGRKNEKDARQRVLENITLNITQLDKRLYELERRTTRMVYALDDK